MLTQLISPIAKTSPRVPPHFAPTVLNDYQHASKVIFQLELGSIDNACPSNRWKCWATRRAS